MLTLYPMDPAWVLPRKILTTSSGSSLTSWFTVSSCAHARESLIAKLQEKYPAHVIRFIFIKRLRKLSEASNLVSMVVISAMIMTAMTRRTAIAMPSRACPMLPLLSQQSVLLRPHTLMLFPLLLPTLLLLNQLTNLLTQPDDPDDTARSLDLTAAQQLKNGNKTIKSTIIFCF